ncbi:p21 regulator protein, putative [Bodo saltans]|uniref:p21 regulator protein, putative n=1 Tax=Bodo saltans TaxID=75058 RepID=A0A0S4JJ90_BODSA|nr:p21 regulator protein, putative [Bodo saltans]|eukprot:CUG90227.1 p21 regulator protein, putative [Bodo saltans]
MGKKHAPPQPIDIFNAPSPRTLLTSAGDKGNFGKRPRSSEGTVTITPSGGIAVAPSPRGASTASVIITPTGSGPAFPESPPPETIEDYGDEDAVSTSADSDEFSSGGNDGNDVAADEESSDFDNDDEEDDEDDEEMDADEEGGSNDDDEDDDGEQLFDDVDATHVNLDFEALPMDEDDVDAIIHLMDQFIPDHLNEVDRDLFGQILAEEPITTLIQLADDADAAPLPESMKHDSGNGVDVFGLVSLINLGHLAVDLKNGAAVALHQILEKNVWSVVRPGLAPHFLLTARDETGEGNKFKSMLLISEHVRNTPQQIVTRLLDFAWETFESDAAALRSPKLVAGGKNKKLPTAEAIATTNSALRVTNPCMFIILAKIQRDAEKAANLAKREKRAGGDAPAKQKRRVEPPSGSSSGAAVLNVEEDFIFWREEDNIMYANRDERVAVHAYRCRAQYDTQPEPERPVTLAFAVSAEGLRKALAQIRKTAGAVVEQK